MLTWNPPDPLQLRTHLLHTIRNYLETDYEIQPESDPYLLTRQAHSTGTDNQDIERIQTHEADKRSWILLPDTHPSTYPQLRPTQLPISLFSGLYECFPWPETQTLDTAEEKFLNLRPTWQRTYGTDQRIHNTTTGIWKLGFDYHGRVSTEVIVGIDLTLKPLASRPESHIWCTWKTKFTFWWRMISSHRKPIHFINDNMHLRNEILYPKK